MFFIIGITSGTSTVGSRRCTGFPCCGNREVSAVVTCVFQQFTFFFLPLFRFGKRYFVSCPNCGAVYELEPEEGRRIGKNPAAEIDPGKMRRVAGQTARFCPRCGARVEPGSRFCPNCGNKL